MRSVTLVLSAGGRPTALKRGSDDRGVIPGRADPAAAAPRTAADARSIPVTRH